MINVGVIGFGYWGPNVARNFNDTPGARVVAISDADEASLRRAEQSYPGIRMARNDADLLTASDIDAIAIVTPVSSHFEIAKAALLNGKHIFVEKPFTASVAQAEGTYRIG